MKKAEIVRYHIKYPVKKNIHLIARFENEFKFHQQQWVDFDLNDDITDDTYRLKSAKYPQLKDDLYTWHQQKRALKIQISDDVLIELSQSI